MSEIPLYIDTDTNAVVSPDSPTTLAGYNITDGNSGDVANDAIWDAKGDLAGGTGADTAARLPIGTDTQVLTADSAEATGMKWAAPTGGTGDVATDVIWDAKGDLAGGTGSDTAVRLAVGTNDQVLTADSAEATGMKWATPASATIPIEIQAAASDQTTSLTTGTAKLTFRTPEAFTLTGLRASVNTAPTGSVITVDVNQNGASLMNTTKLTIDAGETSSTTAATPPVITTTVIADDAEITIDIDTIGSSVAGKGLIVSMLGTRDGSVLIPIEIQVAASDEITDLTTGTGKVTFRAPQAFTLTAVRASLTTAATGAPLQVDINEGGVSVLSTVISIDAGETTSTTAATPPVISDSTIGDDAVLSIDIDQIGSTIAGTGLKVTLIGTR
jgi:hypothetical protein